MEKMERIRGVEKIERVKEVEKAIGEISKLGIKKKQWFWSKCLSSYNLQVLAKTNSFRIRYGFVDQTLDIRKSNTVVLKMMMMSNFH